ncbi:MAG TPA: DUF6776 family protein [Castellaniella sp.]|nr:DUF6776 family protein [Castellaniella sp.]
MRHFILRWLVVSLLLILAFMAGALVMHFGMHAGQQQQILDLQAQLQTAQTTADEAQARVANLQGQLDIEAATRHTLESTLGKQQGELAQTRDQLAFYEQLIPPGPTGAIAIRAFDVHREGEFLRYRVLLSRNNAAGEAFNGRMRFMGNVPGDANTGKIELSAAKVDEAPTGQGPSANSGNDPFALAFEQFQRSQGVLQWPPGAGIQSVTLQIIEDGVIRATQDAVIKGAAPTGAPGAKP